MCGDFNAHNTSWSHKDDARGLALESFMIDNDLGLINSEVKTHFNSFTGEWSLLDLSLVHPALFLDFEATVLSDCCGSDHCPTVITLNGTLFENDEKS